MPSKCPNGHDRSWKCHKPPPATCQKCEKKAKDDAEKLQKAFERQKQKEAEQAEHARRMAELDEQVATERAKIRDAQLEQERKHAISEKEKELQQTISLGTRKQRSAMNAETLNHKENAGSSSTPGSPTVPVGSTLSSEAEAEAMDEADQTPTPLPKSTAQQDWEYQKNVQGANSDAIDGIMELIGLEAVKSQVLGIKAKIDITKKQNTSMKDERFNIVLLGNPGTGT